MKKLATALFFIVAPVSAQAFYIDPIVSETVEQIRECTTIPYADATFYVEEDIEDRIIDQSSIRHDHGVGHLLGYTVDSTVYLSRGELGSFPKEQTIETTLHEYQHVMDFAGGVNGKSSMAHDYAFDNRLSLTRSRFEKCTGIDLSKYYY